jgi:hypothetical protein
MLNVVQLLMEKTLEIWLSTISIGEAQNSLGGDGGAIDEKTCAASEYSLLRRRDWESVPFATYLSVRRGPD